MKILIVGGGVAGLAAYHILDKQKFEVDIVEKRKELQDLGYTIILSPVGIRALRKLGCSDDEINNLGTSVDGSPVWDKDGKQTSFTDFKPLKNTYDDFQVVSRHTLYSLLVSKASPTSLKLHTHPISFEEQGSQVLVTFSDNTKKEYDLVIGADGVHSIVREHIFPKTEIEDVGIMYLLAWFPREKVSIPTPLGVMDNKTAGIIFCDSGEKSRVCLYFYKSIPKSESEKYTPSDYRHIFKEDLKDFNDIQGFLDTLPPAEEIYKTQDRQFTLDKMYKGSMVLIGDAGHVRSIFGGSGTSMALEDAVVLGTHLNNEENISVALEKYSESQHKRGRNLILPNLGGEKLAQTFNDFLAESPLFK